MMISIPSLQRVSVLALLLFSLVVPTLLRGQTEDVGTEFVELNLLEYRYLSQGDVETAIRIFELNVEAYPEAANPYDSLGEAYLKVGDREKGIANYRRSLELNPGNDNARQVLGELGVEVE